MIKLLLFTTVSLLSIFVFHECIAQSYVPQWNDSRMKVKTNHTVKAYAFNLADVKLLPGMFSQARDKDVAYLFVLEQDRLLADFRTHSGLKAKGERYGGWESLGLAGHTLGHYLSALSMYYASTGNQESLKRAQYIVKELLDCQKARKNGYIGAIPREDSLWAEVAKCHIRSKGFDLNGAWSPWYTVHKIMSGLLDAYLYCNNATALKVVKGMADWTGSIIADLDDSLIQKMLVTEYGGMNDALVNVYAVTGNKKYLDLSYKFYDRRILDSLAAKADVLPGKHSNTQIPKIIGSARRYQLTGDKKDARIARFFWETVTKHHSYATGGNSNYEYLGTPDELSDKLSDNTTETCNTYNMLKLTGGLFATDPSASLMDYYEKALYNHILASQNHETGMVTYFVSLRMGGKKEYSDQFNSFTCCVGTGMENHVKYNENIFYRGKDGSLYVNLFIPSVLNWKEKGVRVKQETSLPSTSKVTFTITTAKPASFVIRIRKPHWANSISAKINGIVKNIFIDNEGYVILNRRWMNNDKIEIILPLHLYAEPVPGNVARQAVFYGPVLLAGVLGDKEPAPSDVPVFVTDSKDVDNWMKMVNEDPLTFKTTRSVTSQQVNLIPFNRTANQYYTVYWDVFSHGQWLQQQKIYEEEKRIERQLELQTTDVLRIGEMQPERDHDVIAEKTQTGDEHNRKWRMASDSGFISFKMKTDPAEKNTLVCSYWGTDNRGRSFDIYVDDTIVASEDLNKFKSSRFYEITYPIPRELTTNKNSVIINFIPKPGNSAGPVYGIKMVRGDITGLVKP